MGTLKNQRKKRLPGFKTVEEYSSGMMLAGFRFSMQGEYRDMLKSLPENLRVIHQGRLSWNEKRVTVFFDNDPRYCKEYYDGFRYGISFAHEVFEQIFLNSKPLINVSKDIKAQIDAINNPAIEKEMKEYMERDLLSLFPSQLVRNIKYRSKSNEEKQYLKICRQLVVNAKECKNGLPYIVDMQRIMEIPNKKFKRLIEYGINKKMFKIEKHEGKEYIFLS